MTQTQEAARTPVSFFQITDLSSAVGIQGNGGAAILMNASGGAIRYRVDGGTPTGTVGMLLAENATLWYVGDLSLLKFINDQGATSTLNATTFA